MRLHVILYIALNFILLQLGSLHQIELNSVLNWIAVIAILTVGVAHGAIDNIMYGVSPKQLQSNIVFIAKYVGVILLFVLLWLILPNLAYCIFILVSSYHFGQSQFSEYSSLPQAPRYLLSFSWGLVILFSLIQANQVLFTQLNADYFAFMPFAESMVTYSDFGLAVCILIFLSTLIFSIRITSITMSSALKEAYLLVLIVLSCQILPPLWAFTLFFICIHSMSTIRHEFLLCKQKFGLTSYLKFIQLLSPLTISSILGIAFVLGLEWYFELQEWIPFTLIIITSCVTFPHAYVMDVFYTKSNDFNLLPKSE